MKRTVRIVAGGIRLVAELNDTKTAAAIWDALPLEARVNRWGEEIYFPIPVSLELEDGRELVDVGDLGYWPRGNAFCVFFGPTPASQGDEVRPASAVTVFGRVVGDTSLLKEVPSGAEVTVDREADG